MNSVTNAVKSINTVEKFVIGAVMVGIMLVATPEIIYVGKAMGIEISNDVMTQLIDSVNAGNTLAGAFALVLGVTVPAWASAAAAAFATTGA